MGVMIAGVLQSVTAPLLLSMKKMQISDLAVYPIFNILFYTMCFSNAVFVFIFEKMDFYLFDFNTYVKE